jgi:1-acyl-sn-glycerol-3-phosphate acyltransferase
MDQSQHKRENVRPLGSYGLLSVLATAGLRATGWRVEVIHPMPPKCVIIVYPHTSNWDFVVGIAAKRACFAGLWPGHTLGFFARSGASL